MLAGCGTDVSGPSSSLYGCVFGEPLSLAVGEAVSFEGTGHRALCLTAPDGPATFIYTPFFAAGAAADDGASRAVIDIDVSGIGLMSAAALGASPAGVMLPEPGVRGPDDVESRPGLRRDEAFHHRLREREIAELEPRIRAAAAPQALPGPPMAAQTAPEVGELMELNVSISCSAHDVRTAQVMHVSEHAVVAADLANPDGFGPADYAHFADMFDSLIHPVGTRYFGTPSDIDGNGRTIIFFTRAVNDLPAPSPGVTTAAVFWAGDLFPSAGTDRLDPCPGSNEAELFYVMVPETEQQRQQLRQNAIHIIGHEYQHLLNAARRLYVNGSTTFERTWLNEGLSHIAEELLFYEVSGLTPRSNITLGLLQSTPGGIAAFNQYMGTNHHNITRFLERPDTVSLMGLDRLPTRGAAWSFLRYAADRSGAGDEHVFFQLVNSTTAGLRNLDQVLGTPALRWIQDWAVGLYADDHDDIPDLAAELSHPSWNFRDIFRGTNRPYPLVPRSLAAGAARGLTLQAGAAGYIVFGVEADGRAAIHVESNGQDPPPRLRGTFLRIH